LPVESCIVFVVVLIIVAVNVIRMLVSLLIVRETFLKDFIFLAFPDFRLCVLLGLTFFRPILFFI